MGLDFTIERRQNAEPADMVTAHWSYGGFMLFRRRLAETIGIDNLDEMRGFGGERPWSYDHPLHHLIHHSDCDGDMRPATCSEVYPALLTAIESWPLDYDRANAEYLAMMMRHCADHEEYLVFC